MSQYRHLLNELSIRFVEDLRRSQYYQHLRPDERTQLEDNLTQEQEQGRRPLVPGAHPSDLARCAEEIRQAFGLTLTSSLLRVYAEVDGFTENGVIFYSSETDDPEYASGPTLLAENIAFRSSYGNAGDEYLVIGDSDLCYFAWRPTENCYLVLWRETLEIAHRFRSADEMMEEMLLEALGFLEREEEVLS